MMHVHHGTVESYLEDIIMQSLEKTADEQVRTFLMSVCAHLFYMYV